MTAAWLAAALLAAPARAEFRRLPISTAAFVSPSTGTYSALTGTVGAVRVEAHNVFDPAVPGEDWWPFRVTNLIHIRTRPQVIRREILPRPGGRWDPLEALESERNLRASRFIREAEVRPARNPAGLLDLDVQTRDSWTFQPQVSIGTEGGERYLSYGIEELNVLGYGKTASFFRAHVGDRTRNEARYFDPRLGGSRVELTTLYASTHRGDEIGVLTRRPFFSLESPYSWSALWARVLQEDVLYRDAAEASKFAQNFRSVTAELGARVSAVEDPVQRVSIGTHYSKDAFHAAADTAGGLPVDRELSGPVVGYALIQPRYVKETYINKIGRVEDFNLGNELSVAAGSMLKTLGSDRDLWTLDALDQQGLGLGEGRFALAQAGVRGRMGNGGRLENAIFYANLNLFWKTWLGLPQTWVAHLEWNATNKLDRESQIILGGGTGLRGYKNNSFVGGRSMLLNLEDRFFLTKEFFHLFYVGAATFFETGAVAPEGGTFQVRDFKSDVGLGLRFAPTRGTTGDVIRVDVAYALDRGPGPSRWVLSIRGGQAFQIFNSTNRSALRTPAALVSDESAGSRLRKR